MNATARKQHVIVVRMSEAYQTSPPAFAGLGKDLVNYQPIVGATLERGENGSFKPRHRGEWPDKGHTPIHELLGDSRTCEPAAGFDELPW